MVAKLVPPYHRPLWWLCWGAVPQRPHLTSPIGGRVRVETLISPASWLLNFRIGQIRNIRQPRSALPGSSQSTEAASGEVHVTSRPDSILGLDLTPKLSDCCSIQHRSNQISSRQQIYICGYCTPPTKTNSLIIMWSKCKYA